jgi:hypothetical protein
MCHCHTSGSLLHHYDEASQHDHHAAVRLFNVTRQTLQIQTKTVPSNPSDNGPALRFGTTASPISTIHSRACTGKSSSDSVRLRELFATVNAFCLSSKLTLLSRARSSRFSAKKVDSELLAYFLVRKAILVTVTTRNLDIRNHAISAPRLNGVWMQVYLGCNLFDIH